MMNLGLGPGRRRLLDRLRHRQDNANTNSAARNPRPPALGIVSVHKQVGRSSSEEQNKGGATQGAGIYGVQGFREGDSVMVGQLKMYGSEGVNHNLDAAVR